MVRRSMKRGYTKRRIMKRRSTKRRNTKRRNKKNKTKRKMRGGTGRVRDETPESRNAKLRARFWRRHRDEKQREREAMQATSRSSSRSHSSSHSRSHSSSHSLSRIPHPLSFNILNTFFKEEDGWFGGISYKLNMPKNKIYLISAHGKSIPNQFFVIPEGLTLYLPIPGGQPNYFFMMRGGQGGCSWDEYVARTYIREYSGGSLIQDYDISFSPFFGGEHRDKFTERGLLMYDAPRITVKNAKEANEKLIEFLSRRMMKYRRDKRIERDRAYINDQLDLHLVKYEKWYFQNNIDDIISKDKLRNSIIESRIPLSLILGRIAEKKESDESISGEWFGTFCRSGDFIDIDKFNQCSESGLPKLTAEFFEGNFHYEGITSELTKQKSLASNNPTINFKQILDEVYNKKEQLGIHPMIKGIVAKVHDAVSLNKSISLRDVCVVFQLKQKLIEES